MTTVSLYERLARTPDGARAGTRDDTARDVAADGLRQIAAHALQSTGDQVVASLVGGHLFGRWADRSSRQVMIRGAAACSTVILALLALLAVPGAQGRMLLHPAVYLLLALTHTGVRVAPKTYVVDMAGGDRRTEYVAVANTVMGALLLGAGAVSSVLASSGPEVAPAFLGLLGAVGVVTARTLPEVSAR